MKTQRYVVEVEFDETTGDVTSETWRNPDGQLDRPNGPAVVSKLEQNGMEYQAWYRNGKLSREGGPASVHFDLASGKPIQEVWSRDDLTHRDADQPAVVKYDRQSGDPEAVEYWRDGKQYLPKP